MSISENPQEESINEKETERAPEVSESKTFEEETTALIEESDAVSLPSEDEIEEMISKDVETNELSEDEKVDSEESEVEDIPKVIPKKGYDSMTEEDLLQEFKTLLRAEKVQDIKEHVEGIKTSINTQFDAEENAAKETFLKEGGNIIDFRHFSPVKKAFNELYYEYRNKRSRYYQSIRRDQQENLKEREAIIEDLKGLRDQLGGEDSFNTTYNKFKSIQERWHNAGNIPRDRYNLIWNTYYHHVDNFYEYLHLNREFRDKHFQENLNKKLQLIARAEELAQENDVNRAFKELQLLHRMWKDEIGPVAREYSDEIWDTFSQITKKIHDARQEFFKEKEKGFEKNYELKVEVVDKIKSINEEAITSHNGWQQKIKQLETFREEFFKIGRVPNAVNEEIWNAFKTAVRQFNHNKNDFYKSQKKEQYDNLNKKQELVKIAEENKESDDFEVVTPLMKKIQDDWKKIGHVPRKDSDKIWKQFKGACNFYFDRINASKNKASEAEEASYLKKEELLQTIGTLQLEGEPAEGLKTIKAHIAQWKELGRVPHSKREIEQRFNKVLDGLFKQLDLSRKEVEMIKYENKIAAISQRDDHALGKERFFITKKIDEIKSEINQLENNLGFFQYVSDDNPMVKEVHKNINKQKESLELWKAKLKKIKSL